MKNADVLAEQMNDLPYLLELPTIRLSSCGFTGEREIHKNRVFVDPRNTFPLIFNADVSISNLIAGGDGYFFPFLLLPD